MFIQLLLQAVAQRVLVVAGGRLRPPSGWLTGGGRPASQGGLLSYCFVTWMDFLCVLAWTTVIQTFIYIHIYLSIYPNLSQPNNSDKMPLFIRGCCNNSQKEGANKKMTQKKGYYSDCME
jgi:hypothetical protein